MITSSNNHRTAGDEHESVWELLPWHANATLQSPEALRVERHIATCHDCAVELERCRRVFAATQDIDVQPWSPSPAHFAQVLTHIDRAERIAASRPADSTSPWLRLRNWLAGAPRPMQWALAGQSILVLVLGGALVLAALPQMSPYQTMSQSEQPSTGTRARVRMVPAGDMTSAQLRDLLQSVGGDIVHGPSQTGVYTVELPLGRSQEASIARSLEVLRANPKIRLAEPVGSVTAP